MAMPDCKATLGVFTHTAYRSNCTMCAYYKKASIDCMMPGTYDFHTPKNMFKEGQVCFHRNLFIKVSLSIYLRLPIAQLDQAECFLKINIMRPCFQIY